MTFLHCRAYIWNSQLFARKCFLFSTSARQVQVLAEFPRLAVGTLGRLSLGSSHLQIVFFHLHWMMRMRAAHFLALLLMIGDLAWKTTQRLSAAHNRRMLSEREERELKCVTAVGTFFLVIVISFAALSIVAKMYIMLFGLHSTVESR
ncbi:hypothetical protein Ddc_17505 [Ditylenchus destructor]|nr:hypothetical protein Ddc_17505 [Ditylenchus destructor]